LPPGKEHFGLSQRAVEAPQIGIIFSISPIKDKVYFTAKKVRETFKFSLWKSSLMIIWKNGIIQQSSK
jgi:hypothetical protein